MFPITQEAATTVRKGRGGAKGEGGSRAKGKGQQKGVHEGVCVKKAVAVTVVLWECWWQAHWEWWQRQRRRSVGGKAK